ncbi:hypothetical protein yc1106_00019 [Curvularia clavata]|uniref:C2H2-type domain-containing protein n=1 Tax=Curvularia clavata TaxID=95742 RepID=A0A9Q9DN83_CURCL|nr:hypothetical protein yc1106_00019 [Curvularia clavata]
MASVSERCQACIMALKTIMSTLFNPDRYNDQVNHEQLNDELERFSLWIGNIGAMHQPESSMSLESRLCGAGDVLTHILELLDNLNEVAKELLEIVSGERKGEIASVPYTYFGKEYKNEETELLEEIGASITRLFRVSGLIRQAAPTDLFAKALSRHRYRFNDQFDIAHVGEKYPKLATKEYTWLQQRLGRAITQRRHYLSYIQDHREKLEGVLTHENPEPLVRKLQATTNRLPATRLLPDYSSQPSTFFTKASSLTPGHITPQMLAAEEESDSENDARSYTTMSRSIDGDLDSSATGKIPKLDELRTGSKKDVECPFCFRTKRFKNEQVWRRHVFSDLRSYVCTFPDCDAPYFDDINEWFDHEMQTHRVSYTCRLCESKTFQLRERYLAHVRKHHPDILKDGEQQPVLDIARKPFDQIPAQECPCCSEWVNRLEERAKVASMPFGASGHTLSVVPTVFKRHLASHLEQLALFAIPIDIVAEGDVNSNAAIRKDLGALSQGSKGSDLSTLSFDSSKTTSPVSKGQSVDVSIAGGVDALAWNEDGGREERKHLLDRRRTNVPTIEPYLRPSSGGDENDEFGQEAVAMDLKVGSGPIIPTYEGFRIHIRQLNPRLADYMVERLTQGQIRRYKRMIEFKVKHFNAVKNRDCSSGKFCPDLGGESQQLPARARNKDFNVEDDGEPSSEGNVVSSQFPFGVPLPPVKCLPAEFECPLCFKVKKFYKPSDWTKHVHEDIQPFTCTFPNCGEPKSFKRKADWVRHENERHRHLECWSCQIAECNQICYRKDTFVQHLIREHKIAEPQERSTKGANKDMSKNADADDIWSIVARCRRDTAKQPKDEPCRFCGNICISWKKLMVHLAKHMEQISMPILPLVEKVHININTISGPVVETAEHLEVLSGISAKSSFESSSLDNSTSTSERPDTLMRDSHLRSVLESQEEE